MENEHRCEFPKILLLIVWLTKRNANLLSPNLFSPRRLISNLQYSKKHRNKVKWTRVLQPGVCEALSQPPGQVYRDLGTRLCFVRAMGQQNSCFLTEGKAFQVLIFPVSLPASTGRAETLQVLQREVAEGKHFRETLELR